jgi:putative phosphoribosyl transferase
MSLPHDAHLETIEEPVAVRMDGAAIEGTLAIPDHARGIVVFAHGSGSGRHSPRNRFVAEELHAVHTATLLLDLLTPAEEAVDLQTRELRFDIALLSDRLVGAIEWLAGRPDTRDLAVGLFGASTGGGAALVAAAREPNRVGAVVSRSGRPDLAGSSLAQVDAPTLLIVGERDPMVMELNQEAMAAMKSFVKLQIVPGATHLFEEAGTMDQVARLTNDWFVRHLPTPSAR